MTANPTTTRTEAEQAIARQFEEALGDLPGAEHVRALRAAAFDKFRRAGLPHRRVEEYKYTDLRALVRKAAPLARRPTETAAHRAATEGDALDGIERYRLVLVDGYFFDALSDRNALAAAGVDVSSAGLAMKADGEVAQHLLAVPENAAGDIALALDTMFATDGVVATVRNGAAIDKPLEIMHVSTSGEARSSSVRSSIHVGEGASLKIIETYRGPSGVAHQNHSAMRLDLGRGATVQYARLQAERDATLHLDTTLVKLASAARLAHLSVTAGAAVSRSQMFITTGGAHAQLGIFAAGMFGAKQHGDTTLLISHALPGANTRVLVKSVVDGEAQGVFQGKIVVEPDAQKTDAKMMAKALLLSDTAEFASKPELEIFADDVQCGHGSTSGRIDDEQLFYLMARGVPRAEAERLLIEAFLDEAIDALGDDVIGAALKRTVKAWLEKRGVSAE